MRVLKPLHLLQAILVVWAPAALAADSDGDGVDDVIDVCCETPTGVTVDAEGRPIGDLDGDCDVDLTDFALMQDNFTGPLQIDCCAVNGDCATGEYCQLAAGSCTGQGQCVDEPVNCPAVFDPVCGCDGNTYENACLAAQSGVNVDYTGPCASCVDNTDCQTGEYCAQGVGDCDGNGQCAPQPEACPLIYDPVCGCDGMTYTNACEAAMAGVNVDAYGVCNACTSNADCDPQDYCATGAGACGSTGTCEPRPQVCPLYYDPVCGCDGVTYGNACVAAAAGVNVDYDGACNTTGCQDNGDCASGSYCQTSVGDCGGNGSCAPQPVVCTQIYDPVCGCDGVTYGNACQAGMAGVNIDHTGECATSCQDNSDCDPGEYCATDAGNCGGVGECAVQPEVCPTIYAPVCGCDGNTYGNACGASAAGVSVDYAGECTTSACMDSAECDPGDFCQTGVGDCGGSGTCTPQPVACIQVFDPVCGCDGNTYVNACVAAQSGVNIAYNGECVPTCQTNGDCAATEYCATEVGDCTGMGTCVALPQACPDVFDPVCGCDGNTYTNECQAAQAGVNVAHDGDCSACTVNGDCAVDEFCESAIGSCGGVGECARRPVTCPTVYDPVCGCDGVTYGNACEASFAGVSVEHFGPCTACDDNGDCASEEYCAIDEGDCGGQGECTVRPQVCPLYYAPVCGCDGVTYNNPCFAAMAGTGVDHQGQCSACTSNQTCDPVDYCEKPIGDCDTFGECVRRPPACPAVYEPVCGCDGVTYGNACEAALAGVNIDYFGECNACQSNSDCASGDYCQSQGGDCGGDGTCEARPQVCPLIWSPVCGCDGVTYGNACEAAKAGISVDYSGVCVPTGCTGDSDCEPSEYCSTAAGDCDGTGTCVMVPENCPDVYDPVCGCDGNTYSNVCYAAAAGVNVAYAGECNTCTCNSDCEPNEYCALSGGVCAGEGQCVPRPQVCPEVWQPVCGCDGVTYGNACTAAAAGVNISANGPCPTPTCQSNADCGQGEYCTQGVGNCGGEGECAARPEVCLLVYDPVCGCDGQTYGNACQAAAAGVSIDHYGVCVPTCQDNSECPPTEYCQTEAGDCDGSGACAARPQVCPDVWLPVCGCDGYTYGNACDAAMAGVSVDSAGPCP